MVPRGPSHYGMTRWQRADFGRPTASMRFSTATPMAALGELLWNPRIGWNRPLMPRRILVNPVVGIGIGPMASVVHGPTGGAADRELGARPAAKREVGLLASRGDPAGAAATQIVRIQLRHVGHRRPRPCPCAMIGEERGRLSIQHGAYWLTFETILGLLHDLRPTHA
jgi:hypothetical protein